MRKPTKKQLETQIIHLQAQGFRCVMGRKNVEDQLEQTISALKQVEQQYQALPDPKPKSEPKPEPEVKEDTNGDKH